MRRTDPNTARELMLAFATDTGIRGDGAPSRYLWTDAYAVCNYLALYAVYDDEALLQLAQDLVQQVHEVLGRHRADDARQGWLSGLDEAQARKQPTLAGLRIGKPLAERKPREPYDERTEWDRDGQYYHYLTKWAHALHQMQLDAVAGNAAPYDEWARTLMIRATRSFRLSDRTLQLAWKMSIDLSYPLTPATGQHDALDGMVTALTLLGDTPGAELLATVRELALMNRGGRWLTEDTLGLGGLLFDACRLGQLRRTPDTDNLLLRILEDTRIGLTHLSRTEFAQPAQYRLGFRELGLAIGLKCLPLLRDSLDPDFSASREAVAALDAFAPLASSIESFWLDPAHRRQPSWQQHRHISEVMLATSLLAPAVARV